LSKVSRQGQQHQHRPSWSYPTDGASDVTRLLEMQESTRNAVEEGNRLAAENRDLMRKLLLELRGCREELRRIRVVTERADRRRLKELAEKKSLAGTANGSGRTNT
jgi:hypothetical protein